MRKQLFILLLIVTSYLTLGADFKIGETVIQNYAFDQMKTEILDISSSGLVQTTLSGDHYVEISRIKKYKSVDSYSEFRFFNRVTFKIGETVIQNYAFDQMKTEILDISSSGLVQTTLSGDHYVEISRISKY